MTGAPRSRAPQWLLGGWSRYASIFALDLFAIAGSLYLAYLLRFEGVIPEPFFRQFLGYLPVLLAIRLPLHIFFRIHRWSYRLAGLYEALRVILTSATGTAVFLAVAFFLDRSGPPRSVTAIEFLLTTSLLGALRFFPRLTQSWYMRRVRWRTGGRLHALIVGAGNAGELLARDLDRSYDHPYEVVGFVDDSPPKWGTTIAGHPVLGPLASTRALAAARGIDQLLFADPGLPAAKLRAILDECAELQLGYRMLPISFEYHRNRVPMEILQELSPENLLHRQPVDFEPERMRSLIAGRRVLVTGAAGSIGSEICRQVAEYGPAALVLADTDENGLYLLYRDLQRGHPGLELRVELANVRDRGRIDRLFTGRRIQDVFHAAAHKHVPLMEQFPEEAIQNNVTGCRSVAEAAAAFGAERFVLMSSDKAVEPASVMGASKRLAEILVRGLAGSAATRFTSVRFGNVLGSAGSVVPLFKQQIARGGPVTVTHRDCERYIMTLREAVGLVLMAGFSAEGLCVLEMGEPIRILDLARLMITLSGQVPERDVEIAIIGLRPGDKLSERLMTPAEALRSRVAAPMIRAVEVPSPPRSQLDAIAELEQIARLGSRRRVVAGIQKILPDYTPSALWAPESLAPVSPQVSPPSQAPSGPSRVRTAVPQVKLLG
jgi:FlaA1/EpsC-like NDP-sugar epimerase